MAQNDDSPPRSGSKLLRLPFRRRNKNRRQTTMRSDVPESIDVKKSTTSDVGSVSTTSSSNSSRRSQLTVEVHQLNHKLDTLLTVVEDQNKTIEKQDATIANLVEQLTRIRLNQADDNKVQDHLGKVYGPDAKFVHDDAAFANKTNGGLAPKKQPKWTKWHYLGAGLVVATVCAGGYFLYATYAASSAASAATAATVTAELAKAGAELATAEVTASALVAAEANSLVLTAGGHTMVSALSGDISGAYLGASTFSVATVAANAAETVAAAAVVAETAALATAASTATQAATAAATAATAASIAEAAGTALARTVLASSVVGVTLANVVEEKEPESWT